MPKLLSGGVLRSGGSGQFITLPGAQPALGPTPTTGSGFTIITDATGITNYSNRLGFITFDSGVISGDLNQNISIRTTGTGSLQVDAPTTFNNSVSFGNTLTFVDITANGLIRFTGNFPSNSYTTGTLVVTGGVGISENLFVNQHLDVAGDIIGNGNITFDPNVGNISIQPVTGSLTIFPQSSGTLDNVKIGQSSPTLAVFTYTEITQRLLVSSFENSLSTTTGAVVINGGLGVGQDIHANRIFDNNLRVISQINVGKGLSGGGNGPTVSLTNTGVTSLTSIYPRWNFLLLAANQVINHLDKIKIMSSGGYTPKVIIRTSIGSQRPLHPQHQHIADFTAGFKAMCDWVDIIRLDEPYQIFEAFQYAYERTDNRPTILVEWGDYYGEK